jgi:hypothetical protein
MSNTVCFTDHSVAAHSVRPPQCTHGWLAALRYSGPATGNITDIRIAVKEFVLNIMDLKCKRVGTSISTYR